MKYQRIILEPLERMTWATRPKWDGKPIIFEGENPPLLDEGQAWVPIEDRPTPGENQRLVRVLTTERDGWDVVDLTPEEIEAREQERIATMPGVTPLQLIERLVEAGKWDAFEAALGQFPSYVEKAFYAAQDIKRNHHLLLAYGPQFRLALGMTEEEFDTLLTP